MEQNFYYGRTLDNLGISYLGSVAQSAKMLLSYKNGTMTYCLYLAPANMAGRTKRGGRINVCPNSKYCREFCLNGSGHNKAAQLEQIDKGNKVTESSVNRSRIKKTRLFYNDRDTFMHLLIHELKRYQKSAIDKEMAFSVRLNGTSDLSPILFKDPETGLNILELFPNVQFYDYTKVASRAKLMQQYSNYDLTLSYNGYNWNECEKFLKAGGKVAVVFYDEKLPKYFAGYKVVDGNLYDMRYLDPKGCVVGLHYHKTAADYYVDPKDNIRKFRVPDTPFVVKVNDPRIEWY
jgi:hypothetical protein